MSALHRQSPDARLLNGRCSRAPVVTVAPRPSLANLERACLRFAATDGWAEVGKAIAQIIATKGITAPGERARRAGEALFRIGSGRCASRVAEPSRETMGGGE